MCDIEKLQQGFVISSFDTTTLYEPPSNICLRYEKSYIRLKRQTK